MISTVTPGLPLGFHEWMPAAQAVTLGLLTLVQEDVPTVGAALLAAAGHLAWEAAFLGCFLGIWVGDALLYGVARLVGRPLLERPWSSRFLDPAAIRRSEHWFARRGLWLLLSSRFVPGTRLPTYVAAGFLRLPFGRFLMVTGLAVAVWTIAVFAAAHVAGPGLLEWMRRWSAGGWALGVAIVTFLILLRVVTRSVRREFWLRLHGRIGCWTRWEFWPPWLFYLPVVLNYLRLSLRYRGLTVPTAANPGIASGGFVGESKMATLRELSATSPEFTAEAFLLPPAPVEDRLEAFLRLQRQHEIEYPCIFKPDIGQRGEGVKLIRSPEQAAACLRQNRAALVVQRYAPGPLEAGVFYYRFPDEECGHIFAITEKIFPVLTGDGQHTIEELVWRDPRARMAAAKYLQRLSARRTEVLPAGETLRLVEAGNHAQGCIFRDGSHLGTVELRQRMDEISRKLNGFFIGRYDLRYACEDDLKQGRKFQIIELNGATSEATSIYDARNSVFAAYRTLFRQWDLVFAIGAANRRRGARLTASTELWRQWRHNAALVATYPLAD